MADALSATFICALFGALVTGCLATSWLLARDTIRALRDPDWQAEL